MSPHWLTRALVFPSVQSATADGLVAVGGDASPERLVLAYSQGIFPWPSDGLPLLWFSPDPRFVLPLSSAHVPRSLRKTLRGLPSECSVRTDTAFGEVMQACAQSARNGQQGTWITPELIDGYTALHARGLAHSVETYLGTQLVGGLYGVSLGRAFFGESMFATVNDASKIAFVTLMGQLVAWGFEFIDCQVHTPHLERFGAHLVRRATFLERLHATLAHPARVGPWQLSCTPREALDHVLAFTGSNGR
jgi:leucyl/phenylalanyl-tRNA--protein transferase